MLGKREEEEKHPFRHPEVSLLDSRGGGGRNGSALTLPWEGQNFFTGGLGMKVL